VCAEIVDPETILAAEAIPAEVVVEGFVDELPAEEVVIAAEVVPAEIAVESFVEALPVDDIEDAPPLVSAGPAVHDPGGAPMAAFMSSPPAGSGPHRPVVAKVDSAPPIVPVVEEAVVDEPPPLPQSPAVVEVAATAVTFDSAPNAAPAAREGPPPAATPREVAFSLDLAETKLAPALPEPAPADPESIFSLNADDRPTARAPQPSSTSPAAPVPSEEIFSLDAGAAPADDVISLDADAIVIDVEPIDEEAVVAEVVDEPSLGSGSVATPAARTKSGSSASMPALGAATGAGKNGMRKRPPVKITLVRPGEKSPFA
jgi:hypothetical protein